MLVCIACLYYLFIERLDDVEDLVTGCDIEIVVGRNVKTSKISTNVGVTSNGEDVASCDGEDFGGLRHRRRRKYR